MKLSLVDTSEQSRGVWAELLLRLLIVVVSLFGSSASRLYSLSRLSLVSSSWHSQKRKKKVFRRRRRRRGNCVCGSLLRLTPLLNFLLFNCTPIQNFPHHRAPPRASLDCKFNFTSSSHRRRLRGIFDFFSSFPITKSCSEQYFQ